MRLGLNDCLITFIVASESEAITKSGWQFREHVFEK